MLWDVNIPRNISVRQAIRASCQLAPNAAHTMFVNVTKSMAASSNQ
jgi:hypothetical protein